MSRIQNHASLAEDNCAQKRPWPPEEKEPEPPCEPPEERDDPEDKVDRIPKRLEGAVRIAHPTKRA